MLARMWQVETWDRDKDKWAPQVWLYDFEEGFTLGDPTAKEGLVLWTTEGTMVGRAKGKDPRWVDDFRPITCAKISIASSVVSARRHLFFPTGHYGPVISTSNARGDAPHEDEPYESDGEEGYENDEGEWVPAPEPDADEVIDLDFSDGESFVVGERFRMVWRRSYGDEYETFDEFFERTVDPDDEHESEDEAYERLLRERLVDEGTLRVALATLTNLSRVLADRHDLPAWAIDVLGESPDLETQRLLAANPALPEDDYPFYANAHFEAWLTNPALPFFALTHTEAKFLASDKRVAAYEAAVATWTAAP